MYLMKELLVHTFVLFFGRFDASSMAFEVEGRKELNSDCAIPIPKFTDSEMLLQQLACKLAWTESELAQLIDLFETLCVCM